MNLTLEDSCWINNRTEMFWQPHTSSVDFCESNYLLSSYVVEFHNVWSSFVGISLFGLVGLWFNTTHEWRFSLMFGILTFVGIGSMGLHGTLHWVFQSSDELPMIYLALTMVFCAFETTAPKGKPNYPWLPAVMFAVAAMETIIYYAFQQLWFVFLGTFSLLSVLILMAGIMYFNQASRQVQRLFFQSAGSFILLGFGSWVLDFLLCHEGVLDISNQFFVGMTPHVIWHLAAGLGGYLAGLCALAFRMECLKLPYQISHVLGVVPIVEAGKKLD